MNKHVYLIIMAGGAGSRFWPVSRGARPKQFLDILGVGKTFLQQTYERFLPLVDPENILVVTNESYIGLVKEQLPMLRPHQILAEPLSRNTAPCIAYAAFRLKAADPDAVMIVTPADHLITGDAEFQDAISECVEFASAGDAMMTIGIRPTRPDTGYGYIQLGASPGGNSNPAASGGVSPGGNSRASHIYKVKTFTEKPGEEMAKTFIASGEFLWNSGIFVWRADTILAALKAHLGEIHSLFLSSAKSFGSRKELDAVRRIYPATRNISIDFGVLERADNVYVRSSDFGWSDIGTWNSLYQQLSKDQFGNAVNGRARLTDTSGTVVNVPAGKLAVVDGLKDYVVVDTDDVLLVWPRAREQQIKQVVTTLRFEGGEEYL